MRKYLFGLGLILGATSVFASAPQVHEFPYEKTIILPSSTTGEVGVTLDSATLERLNAKQSNLMLADPEGNEVNFELFYQDFGRLKNTSVMEVSSRTDDPVTNLVDNDVLAEYRFDEKKDGREASWALIDLGEVRRLNRMQVFLGTGAKVKSFDLRAGLTPDRMKTVFSKKPFTQTRDFLTQPVRYVKVSFWGLNVNIANIKFIASDQGAFYFTPQKNVRYKMFYGGPVQSVRYTSKSGTAKSVRTQGQLSREADNKRFPIDYDEDGYDNQNDNCPFVSNPSQRDRDEDRVGNDCDNAPNVKNASQIDTDKDGVGDIADNCKLDENPDQANADDDQFGDICDNSKFGAPKTNFEKKESERNWTLIAVIIALLLGVGGYFGAQKFMKEEKKK